jgi:thiamine pyrophosphate-dependent acetolactate synthase large subunit-like protein
MNRLEAIRRIFPLLGGAAVVSNLGRNTYDLYAAGDRPENFYMWGAMGSTAAVGLGLALARPDLRVVVLDGDGSLLMSLGSLATIAAHRPPNLVEVVFDNGTYETTGGQPTHTTRGTDLAAIARGAGLERVATAADLDAFADVVGRALREEGPWFVLARVDQATSFAKVPRRPVYYRDRFMAALGAAGSLASRQAATGARASP